ncbi:hypothetical protein PAXRUDRAFT_260455 [Paxillus rubicundulus Ve08.2h10]|uniref:Uncharacterized protein n=1 Tax=Paxillus rubicundulus Ve08.2h10 TaxID=930991 RepID=A0A0D0DGH4_9AGAM|nr:hypothetical protein PAXRUDRAFT_260455 [Paxillus rubicundulus Ve08.2h10]
MVILRFCNDHSFLNREFCMETLGNGTHTTDFFFPGSTSPQPRFNHNPAKQGGSGLRKWSEANMHCAGTAHMTLRFIQVGALRSFPQRRR